MNNLLKDAAQKKYVKAVIVLVVALAIFFFGNYVGQKASPISANSIAIPADVTITNDQFDPFWKVWKLLSQKYVSATSTDSQKRIWSSIQGLAASQGDPYTVFFPPEENAAFKDDIAGAFQGVGMEIGVKDSFLVVVAPLKGSPAEKAGMKTGDKILSIDGQSAAGMPVEKAVKLIRGPKGTIVKVTVMRPGVSQPLEIPITRDIIDVPTLQTEIKNRGHWPA